jgi:hypothetical protein
VTRWQVRGLPGWCLFQRLSGGLTLRAQTRGRRGPCRFAFHAPRREEGKYLSDLEPVSGIEPLTCRLQEVCSQAAHALAALMTQAIALTAPAALGLSCAPSHEPFHARGGQEPMAVTQRSSRSRRNGAAICHGPTGQSIRSLHCRIKPYLESRRRRGPTPAPGLCPWEARPGARRPQSQLALISAAHPGAQHLLHGAVSRRSIVPLPAVAPTSP